MGRKMPTTNYDSSELIRRRKARTLGLYATNLATARATNPFIVRQLQNAEPTLDVVTEQKQGPCTCVDAYVRRNTPQVNYSGPQGQ